MSESVATDEVCESAAIDNWAVVDNSPTEVIVLPICENEEMAIGFDDDDESVVRTWTEEGRSHPDCWLCREGGCVQRVQLMRSGCEFVLHGLILN